MKTIKFTWPWVPMLLMALWAMGCSQSGSIDIRQLSATQAQSFIQQNRNNPQFVILDVRTPREFSQGRIAGAVILDYHSPNFGSGLQKLDKSKTYLIYCHTGYRSKKTLEITEKMGFKTIYHLERGIVQWYGRNLPVVRS